MLLGLLMEFDFGTSSSLSAGEDEDIGDVDITVAVVSVSLAGAAGEEKKDVIEALDLGFLAVEVAISAALRFKGVVIVSYGTQVWGSGVDVYFVC